MPAKIPAEREIKKFFGVPINDLAISLLNFNSNPCLGSPDSPTPSCVDYINHSMSLYPSLAKAFKDRRRKQKKLTSLEVADQIFTPVWVSPSSGVTLTYPRDFGGDHRTESQFERLGVYSTNQLFAKYTNGNMCAALSSKVKYDASGVESNDVIVDPTCVGKTEFNYIMERGIVSSKDNMPIPDVLRFLAMYERGDGKSGVSLISGCQDFVTGSVNIFRIIENVVDELRDNARNDQYKGVTLSSVNIGDNADSDPEKERSIRFARLVAGSIMVVDHLMILKNIYGVKNLLQFDLSENDELHTIPIDTVIDMYRPIKEYYIMASALNQIK